MSETPRDPYADGYEGDGFDDASAPAAAAPTTPDAPRPVADTPPTRASVVREAPPTDGDDDEYQWHTGLNRPDRRAGCRRVRRRPQGLRSQQDPQAA